MIARLSVTLATCLLAGSPLSAAPVFTAEGFIIEPGQEPRKVELLSASREAVRYREPGTTEAKEQTLREGISVHACEPASYTKAMDLYQGRKYKEAGTLFGEVKERYQPLEALEDGYAALSGFYEMECLRKTGDLEGLAAALPRLPKGILTREFQQRQLELYVFWDAVRTKSWDRVEALAKEHANARLPGDQRAQVEYCHGMALEALNRPEEAVVAYNTALTADGGASEEITRQATLRILGIYKRDPEVQAALKKAQGGAKLTEARALAALFVESLGANSPLPAEFKEFSPAHTPK